LSERIYHSGEGHMPDAHTDADAHTYADAHTHSDSYPHPDG
jgi:hypothetical protein